MTVLESNYTIPAPAAPPAPAQLPLLNDVKLLEYRSESDPDSEFIPKTIGGFAAGTLAMFICLGIAEALFLRRGIPLGEQTQDILYRFAFMIGITGVATSLLLVGLKVRADHSAVQLYARHWLNSITTGAVYAVMIFAPWIVMSYSANQSIPINKFVAAAIWMLLMAFPAVAAKWTIAPHRSYDAPS